MCCTDREKERSNLLKEAKDTPSTSPPPSSKEKELVLTAENVITYVKEHNVEIGIFHKDDVLTASAIMGGNMNYAFRVATAAGGEDRTTATTLNDSANEKKQQEQGVKSIFIKQAPEFVAVDGPDGIPLTSQRMKKEYDCYIEWNKLLGSEFTSKYLPLLYYFDEENMIFAMEFFEGYTLLDSHLVDETDNDGEDVCNTSITTVGEDNEKADNVAGADENSKEECMAPSDDDNTTDTIVLHHPHDEITKHLGEFMGLTHAVTHNSRVAISSPELVSQYKLDYENRPMRDMQLEFVFTDCYREHHEHFHPDHNSSTTTTEMFDKAYMKEIELLKKQYDGETNNLALCHGDLHPGSIMINCNTGAAKIIDPEFVVYGPPGLDVGSLLSGYVLAAIHQAHVQNPKGVHTLYLASANIWNVYEETMLNNGMSSQILRDIEIETVGFALAEVCRTALGFAGERLWLQFDNDVALKKKAVDDALRIVRHCMIARHEGGIQLLLQEMKALALVAD